MPIRVNDPDKLYPQGTMKAVKEAERRFKAPVSRPAPARRTTTMIGPSMGPRNLPTMGPVRSNVEAPKRPDLITYETNPEIDSKTASLINAARVKGYEERLGNVQEAQSALDQGQQRGQFQMGVQGLSNRGALQRTIRSGQDSLRRTLMGEQGADRRLGATQAFNKAENERTHNRALETMGIAQQNALQQAQLGAAVDYFGAGGSAAGAQQIANAPAGSIDFAGLQPPPQPTSKTGKISTSPGKFTTAPGTGKRMYSQYPTITDAEGRTRINYRAMPKRDAVDLLVDGGMTTDEAMEYLDQLQY